MKNLVPTFDEFIFEEGEKPGKDWIESVITFPDDAQLTAKVIKMLQEVGVDTGSMKNTYNAKTKVREIRVFNKLETELDALFKAEEFSSLTIKKYEE